MTAKQQAALTGLMQTTVALAALFIPGLDEAEQLAILAFGGALLVAVVAFLPEPKPSGDPVEGFEKARVRLEDATGAKLQTASEAGLTAPLPRRTRGRRP